MSANIIRGQRWPPQPRRPSPDLGIQEAHVPDQTRFCLGFRPELPGPSPVVLPAPRWPRHRPAPPRSARPPFPRTHRKSAYAATVRSRAPESARHPPWFAARVSGVHVVPRLGGDGQSPGVDAECPRIRDGRKQLELLRVRELKIDIRPHRAEPQLAPQPTGPPLPVPARVVSATSALNCLWATYTGPTCHAK